MQGVGATGAGTSVNRGTDDDQDFAGLVIWLLNCPFSNLRQCSNCLLQFVRAWLIFYRQLCEDQMIHEAAYCCPWRMDLWIRTSQIAVAHGQILEGAVLFESLLLPMYRAITFNFCNHLHFMKFWNFRFQNWSIALHSTWFEIFMLSQQ
ncbi:hypothetical protein Patl1_19618 [Pistacia atlantica]|uniref:Uncharacterized protein n=1 Tax=Pistacia atlantica TaxID=434234 RepID=A0ACC1BZ07_9ROSI|nr:hypothetical protein Patl1_19618 [Pistacia atlantica]